MTLLMCAISLLLLSLLSHILLWRVRLPQTQMQALLIIFIGYAFLFGGLAFVQSFWGGWSALPALSYAEIIQLMLFNASMGMFYTALYSTITVDSPSASLILMADQAGAEGISRAEVLAAFQNLDLYYQARLEKLLESGMVVSQNGRYILMPKGRYFMQVIVSYRQILGLPPDIG